MSHTNLPLLSIVIVNWRSAAYVKRCIASLQGHLPPGCGLSFEVIVVDNTPRDPDLEAVAKFPQVHLVHNTANMGFARANNVGSAHAHGELLLFLNPDTEIIDSSLLDGCSWLMAEQSAGVLGCRLVGPDLEFQPSSIQKYPTILGGFVDSRLADFIEYRVSARGRQRVFSAQPVPVQAVSGAFMLMRRNVFETAGGFCSRYFMYAEDVDLCYRLHRQGYRVYFMSAVRVIHFGGASSRQVARSRFSTVMMHESAFRFFMLHRGKSAAWEHRIAVLLVASLRLGVIAGVLIAIGLFSTRSRKTLVSAFEKWRGVGRWAMGLESWVKDY
jgi:GT2 family glycosyltransferase